MPPQPTGAPEYQPQQYQGSGYQPPTTYAIAPAPQVGAGATGVGYGYGASETSVGVGATVAAVGAAPAEDDAKRMQKKALRILNQSGELIQSIEAAGIDVSEARRALDLARSFLKAGNHTKAIQYAKKSDSLAREKRERAKAQNAGKPVCGTCGAPAEAGWKACPKCGGKIG